MFYINKLFAFIQPIGIASFLGTMIVIFKSLKFSQILLKILFGFVLAIFLISISATFVINTPIFYSFEFNKNNIDEITQIPPDELMRASQQIREYFTNDEQYLNLEVYQNGVLRSIYSEKEISHMKDVKFLIKGVYSFAIISLTIILITVIWGIALNPYQFTTTLVKLLASSAKYILITALILSVLCLLAFQQLFLIFHQISFANDLWILDPSKDYLIIMFPQNFFLEATLFIGMLILIECLILILLPKFTKGKAAQPLNK